MVEKFISINYAIEKIIRDLSLKDREIPIDDIIEWIGEALQYIGSYYQYCEKNATIDIEDYKGELPCDYCKLITFRNYCDNFGDTFNKNLIGTDTTTIDRNSNGNRNYNLTGNVITMGFKTGKVNIQYLAIPLDKDGLPMIPDDINYLDALVWKCAFQLGMQGHTFKNSKLNDIDFTKAKWDRYCLQARASSNSPNLDALERMKNIVIRFKPDLNAYYNNFNTLGKQQYQHQSNNYRNNFL
jgi:hypothetical protein